MDGLSEDAVAQTAKLPAETQDLVFKLLEFPQAPLQVQHIFGPSGYMRELTAAAGTLLVGRLHRSGYDCILVSGALTLFNADGSRTSLKGPLEFRAGPGRQIARVDEDMVFVAVYHTLERDMEVLEEMIFAEPAPSPPFEMLAPDGDYQTALVEIGATAAAVRRLSDRTEDLCPMPTGGYKFKVGRSRIEGNGLIATADIGSGDFIAPATWHGKRTPVSRYANHAKQPNAMFIYPGDGNAWLVSIRAIEGCRGGYDGEEITVDYRRSHRSPWGRLA